jgi:hypothetical protein
MRNVLFNVMFYDVFLLQGGGYLGAKVKSPAAYNRSNQLST